MSKNVTPISTKDIGVSLVYYCLQLIEHSARELQHQLTYGHFCISFFIHQVLFYYERRLILKETIQTRLRDLWDGMHISPMIQIISFYLVHPIILLQLHLFGVIVLGQSFALIMTISFHLSSLHLWHGIRMHSSLFTLCLFLFNL